MKTSFYAVWILIVIVSSAMAKEPSRLLPFEYEDKWGFMDREGNVVIRPEYDGVSDFSEGLARVEFKGQNEFLHNYTYIDETGKRITDEFFQYAEPFKEGLAAVTAKGPNGKQGYIDASGEWVIEGKFTHSFSGGLARTYVQVGDKYLVGFIDKKGEMVIGLRFDSEKDGECDFYQGAAVVKFNGKFGLIDRKGDWILEPDFNIISCFENGLAVTEKNGKWSFIDPSGKVVVKSPLQISTYFYDGMAKVEKNGLYGFINKKGKVVIKPQYGFVGGFYEGLAWVSMECGHIGYINRKGNLVIKPKFRDGTEDLDFHEGLAAVFWDNKKGESKVGYINKKGKFVIPPIYDQGSAFEGGLAYVLKGDKSFYIRKDGTPISVKWPKDR